MEDEKPDISHLVLKPKVVELTDKVARPGDGTAITVQGIHQENVRADEQRAARRKPSLAGEPPVETAAASPGFKVKAPPLATAVAPEAARAAVEPLLAQPPVRRDGTLPPAFRRKELVPTDAPAPADAADGIRVHDMLVENIDADEASGWGQLKAQPRRRKRRTRDFFLLVGTIDLGIAVLMRVAENPMMMIYGLAGITLVTSTLAWIMFFVMDNY